MDLYESISYITCVSYTTYHAKCVSNFFPFILPGFLIHYKLHGVVSPYTIVFIPMWAQDQIYVYILAIFRPFGSLIENPRPDIMVSGPKYYYLYHRGTQRPLSLTWVIWY